MVALHLITAPHDPVPPGAADADLVWAVTEPAVLADSAAGLVADVARRRPEADAVFGDIVIGNRTLRRSAWSPTRAITDPGAVLPLAVRAGTLRRLAVGPGDPGLPLALALDAATVVHVPTVLSAHRDPVPGPTIEAAVAQLRAEGRAVRLVAGPRPHTARLLPAGARPTVSIVIPTAGAADADGRLVDRCLTSLRSQLTGDDEVVVVVGDEFDGDPTSIPVPSGPTHRVVRRPAGPFNFSAAVNAGVLGARRSNVLLLNDDTDNPSPQLLDSLTAHLSAPDVAAVGALLHYPDGGVQHAGIVIDDARPLHSFVGATPDALTRANADVARDVIAVTGACMLVRRADFLAVGGLSTAFPLSFNDVDFCLRLRRTGRRVVMEPAASMTHREGGSREPHIAAWEWDRWIDRWGEVVDPWYHPGHHRPDDPQRLHRNADHLDPAAPFASDEARDTTIRPRVHHARLA